MSKESINALSWGSPAQGLQWGSPASNSSSNLNNPSDSSDLSSLNDPAFSSHDSSSSNSSRPSIAPMRGQEFTPSLKKNLSTPPNFSPRPLFQSSPLNMTPRLPNRPRFNQSGQSNPREMSPYKYKGSPQYQGNTHSFQQRSFSREDSMNNPGGSGNIEDYIHSSMFEDPWKDLPATPIKKLY